MLGDLSYIYLFWVTLFVIGIVNLPLTVIVFRRFIDKGYIFSKILGLALVSYITWVSAALKILPFCQQSIIAVTVTLAFINLFIFLKNKKTFLKLIDLPTIKLFLIEELLFSLVFIFWSYIRGFNPEIRGLEKFMDYGFIQTILRSRFMPPLDMWLSQSSQYPYYTINYYYFGHFVAALLTKLSTVPSEISYNLMLGLICGFCFTGVFSIAANLFASFEKSYQSYSRKALFCGLLGALLVTFGGNLHTIYAFTKGYPLDDPQPFWKVLGTPQPNAYWYPNATRFIPNTIHEFPLYSFVVSDLHGHVSDIPFVLLIIALLFSFFLFQKSDTEKRFTTVLQSTLLGLLLAIAYMTNAWDGIIYLGLSGLVLLVINAKLTTSKDHRGYNFKLSLGRLVIHFNFLNFFINFLMIVFTFILFSLPFNRTFIPFAKGIGINCITPNASNVVLCDHSPVWMLAILWGYFFFFALSFVIFFFLKEALKLFKKKNYKTSITSADIFIVLLIVISTGLLIAPEFIFARDIYPAHYRANTMFKLGYQAFIMLGIVVSFVLFRFLTKSPFQKIKGVIGRLGVLSWWILVIIQLFLVLIYPFFATNSYYLGLNRYQGLNGTAWLYHMYPSDYAAIEYLKSNIGPFEQPTILEAVGESYTDYARISAFSGLPTVLGWPVHEWLWRGSFDEPGKRQEEVRKIYESTSLNEAINLLKKYNVKYVIIGNFEHEKYSNLNENTFYSLGTVVFQHNNLKIFQMNLL